MKLHVDRNRLIAMAILTVALILGLFPFITLPEANISLNFYQTAASCVGTSKNAASQIPEFARAAQNLNRYVFYYVPLAAVAGIFLLLFRRTFMQEGVFIGILGLIWTASLLFVLMTGQGGEGISIGWGGAIIMAAFLALTVLCLVLRKGERESVSPAQMVAKTGSAMQKYGLVLIIVVICLELSVLSTVFLTGENWINLLRQVSINGIMAMGMTFVIITGGIDLSVGSMLAVSGVVAGSIISANPEMVVLAILAAVGVTLVFGLVSGFSIAYFNMPPFIVTLAITAIARGFSLVYADGRPYIITSKAFAVLGKGSVLGIPIPVISFLVVALIMFVILSQTKTGRYIFAVGGNENASRISGVNVKRIKVFVYAVSALLAGFAGVILASRISSGQPQIGEGYETDAIAAAVIGGTRMSGGVGSISGTVLGVLIIGLISNGLTLLGVNSYWQQIVKGVIIFGAVLLDLSSKSRSKT